MKRQHYLILIGLITLTGILGFVGINSKQENADTEVTFGKEMAYADNLSGTKLSKDSSKLDEKKADVDNELVKINDELNALEEEVEVAHEETTASYYHDKFNGRRTASGKVFSNKFYTAAHKTLPFGTKVRVTNLNNDETVIVEINDRGPFVGARQLDLSKKAFMDLTHNRNRGTLQVKVEVLPDDYEEKRTELEEELNSIAFIPNGLDLNEFAL